MDIPHTQRQSFLFPISGTKCAHIDHNEAVHNIRTSHLYPFHFGTRQWMKEWTEHTERATAWIWDKWNPQFLWTHSFCDDMQSQSQYTHYTVFSLQSFASFPRSIGLPHLFLLETWLYVLRISKLSALKDNLCTKYFWIHLSPSSALKSRAYQLSTWYGDGRIYGMRSSLFECMPTFGPHLSINTGTPLSVELL